MRSEGNSQPPPLHARRRLTIEVHLPLKEGAVPHRHAPPRLGVEGRRFVRENVAKMERRGIVYKTQSPWGSRIVLVRKKDGTLRQCIDYRDLNAKLLVQDSPLPRIDTCLEAMTEGFFNEQITQLKKEAESPLPGAPADPALGAETSETTVGITETIADPPPDPISPPLVCERCGEEAEQICNTCNHAYCCKCRDHHTCDFSVSQRRNSPDTPKVYCFCFI